jgi:hypothetical protein
MAKETTVERRIAAEKAWVRKFVTAALAGGYEIAVDYMEGDKLNFMDKVKDVMSDVHACDEEILRVRVRDTKLTRMVLLVYGNADDGSEVFADYSVALEPIMEAIGYNEA